MRVRADDVKVGDVILRDGCRYRVEATSREGIAVMLRLMLLPEPMFLSLRVNAELAVESFAGP